MQETLPSRPVFSFKHLLAVALHSLFLGDLMGFGGIFYSLLALLIFTPLCIYAENHETDLSVSPRYFAEPSPAPQTEIQKQLVSALLDVARRFPRLRYRLLQGLNEKLGTGVYASAKEIAESIKSNTRFNGLSQNEMVRIWNAAQRHRGKPQDRRPFPKTPPGPTPTPIPSPPLPPPERRAPPPRPTPSPEKIPQGTPVPGKGLHEEGEKIVDHRVRADQQRYSDCWAHAFGVTFRLALLGHGGGQRRALASLSPDQLEIPPSIVQTASRTHGNGPVKCGLNCDEPQFEEEWLKSAWEKGRTVTQRLSRMNGGGGSGYLRLAIDLAKRLDLQQAVAMKVIPRQRVSSAFDTIIEGMRLGVRFSGYFGGIHSMAIIGADKGSKTLFVTDSARGGTVRKVNISRFVLDGMVAIVRKDYQEGVDWLSKQGIKGP